MKRPLSYFIGTLLFFFIFLNSTQVSAQENECEFTPSKKAEKLYNEAVSEFKMKHFVNSLKIVEQALAEEEEYTYAWFLMAKSAEAIGESGKTEKAFLKVIELCPKYSPEPYFALGEYYFKLKEYEKAMNNMEAFLNFKQDDDANTKRAEYVLKLSKFRKHAYENPVPFDPLPVAGVSSKADEYLSIISPDNELAFFTRRFKKQAKGDILGTKIEEFSVSERDSGGNFNIGKRMPTPFNMGGNEGGPTVTIDNTELYFTRCDPAEDRPANCDIYYSKFKDGKWSEIKNLGAVVNDKKSWDSQPSVSSDGNTLYFVSDRPGGFGQSDIYKTEKDKDGNWQKPINLGKTINTPGDEKSPFIHTDSKTLYFSSDSLTGMGGLDIFLTKYDEKAQDWQTPKNIGYPINNESNDLGFFVSTEGKTGYFASNKTGQWDVYSFYLYPEARPEKVLFMKGQLKDEAGKPTSGTIQIKDTKTNQVYNVKVDSLTGKYVSAVNFNNDMVATVKKKGYAASSTFYSKTDTSLSKPITADLTVKPVEVGSTFILNNINFSTNSYVLNETAQRIIDGLVDFLQENKTVKIAVQGHTDDVNDDESNRVLSQNRAKAVYDYIIEKGINQARLSYAGFGEKKPIASNETEIGRAKNRRTEFVITAK